MNSQAPTEKGFQKVVFYVLLLAYFIVPIYQMINCLEIQKVTDKKEEIDKSLNLYKNDNNNNYEEINDYNYCQEEDCEENNDENMSKNNNENMSKNNDQEFKSLYSKYDFITIPLFIIIVIILVWTFLVFLFRCVSFQEGAECVVACCICCGKNLPTCVKTIADFALGAPFTVQCFLECLLFIISIVHLNYSKKTKSKLPSSYESIYDDMVHFEKCLVINIVVSILLFCCTIGKHIIFTCCCDTIRRENINVIPQGVAQN